MSKDKDYVFEHVIDKKGYFYMHVESLRQWQKDHPRMLAKLQNKGIHVKIGKEFIKLYANGR